MSLPPDRPRAVFDCNTFIQAAAFDTGPAGACLRLVESGIVELFVSKPMLAELRRVLGYEEVLAISPNLTPERVAGFLKRVTFRATLVRRVRHLIDYPRDPDDEPYIDLAAAIRADYLVTRDKDLLSLMTGHSSVCKEFRQKTRPLAVVNPVDFLAAIKRS
jgi:putative PIN family toxin of toxin-antitoxin system